MMNKVVRKVLEHEIVRKERAVTELRDRAQEEIKYAQDHHAEALILEAEAHAIQVHLDNDE